MKRELDPYTLRWASRLAHRSATMARRQQMIASPESARFLRNKANALDELADTMRHKADAIEPRKPAKNGRLE